MRQLPPAEECAAADGAAAARLATDGVALLPLPQSRVDNANGAHFPLGLTPAAGAALTLPDTLAWVAARRDELEAALLAHGGILFRGFALRDAAAFDAFMARRALSTAPAPPSC
jgi:hypothetical protein